MIISLAVHGAPFASQSPRSALKFAQAALAEGHEIYRVFFYHDAVRLADTLSVVPQDEVSLLDEWLALKSAHNVELTLCIAAAIRRGVLNAAEQLRYQRAAANAHPQFEVVGLGQLIDAVLASDRFITFAA